jgi:hypothetical protein
MRPDEDDRLRDGRLGTRTPKPRTATVSVTPEFPGLQALSVFSVDTDGNTLEFYDYFFIVADSP